LGEMRVVLGVLPAVGISIAIEQPIGTGFVRAKGECIVPAQIGATIHPPCVPGALVEPGQSCIFTQDPGFHCDNAGNNTCDETGTTWWNGDPMGGLLCSPNKCDGGPKGMTDPNAYYDNCTSRGFTMQLCNPTCKPGHHPRPPGYFQLECDHNHQYTTPAQKGQPMCQPDPCIRGPKPGTAANNASYTECNAMISGDKCMPKCNHGYHASGELDLICDARSLENGGGYDASAVKCLPNHCRGGPYVGADPKADYSKCNKMTTDQWCRPECALGYAGSGDAGILLKCIAASLDEYDASGFSCEPKTCKGGPIEGTRVSGEEEYKHCSESLRTGDTCIPKCPVGWEAEGSFTLTCTGAEGKLNTFNASGARCVPSACTKGPSAGSSSHADYSHCNKEHTGDKCIPKCDSGYTASGEVSLTCIDGHYDASGASCVPGSCKNGPTVLDDSSGKGTMEPDWDRCNHLHTGDICNAKCPLGYTVLGGGFPLVCNNDTYAVKAGITCARSCTEGPVPESRDPHASYDTCNSKASGDTCKPTCAPGWTVSGSFTLVCKKKGDNETDGKGGVYDASSVTCVPNACSGGARQDEFLDPLADYSNCDTKVSGEKCSPICPRGWSTDGDLALVCTNSANASGVYSARGATCDANTCTEGPLKFHKGMDLSPCKKLKSGDICYPKCKEGTHLVGSIELKCTHEQYDASGAQCVENQCKAGRMLPGYIFAESSCSTVSDCMINGKVGMTCAPGYLEAGPAEGGLQLVCPEDGDVFLPSGCSAVACPTGASMCTGVCKCNGELGYAGILKWQANGWKDGKYIEGKWLNECTKTSGAGSVTTPTPPAPAGTPPAPPQPAPPEQTTVTETCHDWLYRIALIILLVALAALVVFHMKVAREHEGIDRDLGLSQSPAASNRPRSLHSPGDYGTGHGPGTYTRRHGPADEEAEDEYLF